MKSKQELVVPAQQPTLPQQVWTLHGEGTACFPAKQGLIQLAKALPTPAAPELYPSLCWVGRGSSLISTVQACVARALALLT